VFHDCVGIQKDLKAVRQVRDGRVGGHRRRSSLRYSYNAGCAGVVGFEGGTDYPACDWGVDCFGSVGEL